MSELKIELDRIEEIIESRANYKSDQSAQIQKINTKDMITSLKSVETEIIKKHKEAKKLWKNSVKISAEFIKANLGSKQVNPPTMMPEEPKEIEEIRGYIQMFESMTNDEINITIGLLREIFLKTSEGLHAVKHQAYLLQTAISGEIAGVSLS